MSYTLPSLEALQDEVAAQFALHSQFGGATPPVNVFSLRRKEVATQAKLALNAVRVCGIVLPFVARSSKPVLQVNQPNKQPPFYDSISTIIQFIEIPELNNTGLDASQYCVLAVNLLSGYTPTGMNTPLSPTPDGVQFVGRGDVEGISQNIVVWSVKLETQGCLGDVVTQVAEPTYSMSAGAFPVSLTLACATAGAQIRYTTDGVTYPDTTNGAQYTAPISISGPCLVLARAWKDGMLTSDELRLDITA